MREILFRGKRVDDGKWVEGFYSQMPNTYAEDGKPLRHCIDDYPCCNVVNPETVGQYTGLTDKNGRRIFEGDVVAYREYGNLVVAWDDGTFQLMREDTLYELLDHYSTRFSVVIGNIYDNPELLGEVSDNG